MKMLIKYFQQYRWPAPHSWLASRDPWTFICKLQVGEINVLSLHKNTKVGMGVVQLAECLSSIQNPLHHINQVE